MVSGFENLETFELFILRTVNRSLAHPIMDQFWLTVTQLHKLPWFWIFIVPILLLAMVYIYRGQIWKPLLFSGLAVAAADMLSYRVIKGMITRPRPFQNEEIADWVRKVGEAHGPSFPSNHAANVFAVAMILGWYFPRARYFFYAFATLVAYSRVALGVHYPSDVLCGALLGIFVGLLIRSLVLNQFRLFQPRSKISSSNADISLNQNN